MMFKTGQGAARIKPGDAPRPASEASRSGVTIPEFDILRSIAILLLFFHHGGVYNFSILGFALSSISNYMALFLLGSFIFISGYLSVRSLEKTSLLGFLTSKLVRIYIPYLAALALFVGYLDVEVSQADFVLHAFGVQILLSPRFTTPILTLWFVGLILVYYVVFGVLQKYIKPLPLLAAAILVTFVAAGFLRAEHGMLARRFFYYFFVYAAGVLAAKTGWLPALMSARYFLVDKLLLAGLGIAVYTPFQAQTGQEVNLPLVAASTLYILSMILLTLSVVKVFVPQNRRLKLFSFISFSSFFAYLFHRPIWKALLEVYSADSTTVMFLYIILVGSGVVLGISYLLQKAYDLSTASLKNATRLAPRRV